MSFKYCLIRKSMLLISLCHRVADNFNVFVTHRLRSCNVTENGCSALSSALRSNSEITLKELDLSYNDIRDSGAEQLSFLLEDPQCELQKLWYVFVVVVCLITGLKCATTVHFSESSVVY